jgi:outer membrane protein assembly factor BamD (BamD/ComL family)
MSVSGIASSILFAPISSQKLPSRDQEIQQEFQQLGKDLKSGNLSAAQTDFVTLQNGLQPSNSSSTSQTNPIAQDFTQLASDLKAGNLSAAQKDFTALQQVLNTASNANTAGAQGHHHHHHAGESSGSDSANSIGGSITQAFTQLGQALQAGNLPNAQSAYTTLQQDFQLFTQNNPAASQPTSSPAATPTSTGISVQA